MTYRSFKSPGIAATLALLAFTLPAAEAAAAACSEGQTKQCITPDGDPGIMMCEWPTWGECMPTTWDPYWDPFGSVDEVSLDASLTQVTVRGWAIDRNSYASPIQVRVTVDGAERAVQLANTDRPDVGAAYPEAGNLHGYSMQIPAEKWGRHTVCVEGINVGAGRNATIRCRSYTIEGKVTTVWGEDDVTRCVDDPIQAINTLPRDQGVDIESQLRTAIPGDTEFGNYQSLNFVTRCGDGALFLAGLHQNSWTGDDWVDLFRVEVSGSGGTSGAVLTKVAKRHLICDDQCNLDASGGTYVTPDGRLVVYGTEHSATGPELNGVRSVTARQF